MFKQILTFSRATVGVILVLAAASSQAQQAPVKPVEIKFGKPEPADFEAKNFVGDSASAAVVLYDFGTTRFRYTEKGFQLESDRTTRIKILKKAGYDYATVEVPLYHRETDEEKIVGLKGFTYNDVAGKIEKAKLESTNMFTEERTKNVRVRKFTLPNVREGAVIEYSYTVSSDFYFNFQPWTFQRDIPTRWSEFRASIPEYFTYKMLMQGYEPLALQSQEESSTQFNVTERVQVADGPTMGGGVGTHGASSTETLQARTTLYHWAMKDVPAMREEPFMTTTEDYLSRINFELAGTRAPGGAYHNVSSGWSKINTELMQSAEFGSLLDRGGFLKEQLQALVSQYPDPAARAAAVRALVMKNVKHDDTNRMFASGSLKHTWDQHRGNSADVNLLLIAALRQAGLAAQPVLLSTRAHGRINQSFPLLDQYNYVIGMLPLADEKELLLDATEPVLPCGVLPQRCLSQIGRLILPESAGEGRWVNLTPAQRHSHYQEVKMTLDTQGNIVSQVKEERGGYMGAVARGKLAELGEKKYVTEQLASLHPSWEIPTYKFVGANEVDQPLALQYECRQPAATTGTAQEFYLKPLASFGESRNPFFHEERKFPVDFGAPMQDVVVLTLTLPAGYVAELPKASNVTLPDHGGTYVYAASSPTPGTVQMVSRLTLAKPVYGAEEYGSLREFYRLALAKQAEAIVVKKQ